MADIHSSVEMKIQTQLTLNKWEADELLYFLKNAQTLPRAPTGPCSASPRPTTDIVKYLHDSIKKAMTP